jgi:hypothetical protein
MTTTITKTSPEFVSWFNACQAMIDSYMESGFPSLDREVLEIEEGSKFIKVVKVGHQRCVYAFVAKKSFSTKTFGAVNVGEIYKPATYKAPAKHARGSVFDSSNGMSRMTAYGPEYLR